MTIQEVKNSLPIQIPVRLGKQLVLGTVRGRYLPYAQVCLPNGTTCEASWETIIHIEESGSELIG